MITQHSTYLWIDAALLTYFILLNGFYAVILILGFPVLFRRTIETNSEDLNELMKSEHLPPVSIIVAAFNERSIIKEVISSVYHLDYPYFSLILVNDGSTDDTLNFLIQEYDLVTVPPAFPLHFETMPVRNVYTSKKLPNFTVIDKENGKKEDALNAGLNFCRTPFYLTTDADTLIEPDALRKLVLPLLTEKNSVGLSGALRISNGCRVEDGLIQEVHLPRKYFAKMQIVEYLRSFFFGRLGWNLLGGPFILCGAFSFLEKKAVFETGGYRADVPAEDIDLTLRLHGKMHELKRDYKINYIADSAIWTQVPQEYRSLSLQRKRWYCSALDVFWKYKYMTFNPTYGRVGFLYLPYLLLGEALAPLVELFAYLYIIYCYLVGVLNTQFFWIYLLIAWGFNALLTLVSLGMEQVTFKKYVKTKEVLQLIGIALIENLGYRQMSVWWRFQGFCRFLFMPKKRSYREQVKRYKQ